MTSITSLPQEIIGDILWWTRQICRHDIHFCDLRLVNRRFNEAVLYAIYLRDVHPVANTGRDHEPSCIVCLLSRTCVDFHSPVYSRMHLQAQLSRQSGPEEPSLRRFHHTLRAARVWLEEFLEHPSSQSARDVLVADSRFQSSSAHPAFTGRVAVLLCDTVVNPLDVCYRDCLGELSTNPCTHYLTQTSVCYWVILAIYNLGDFDCIKRRVWALLDMDIREMESSTLLLSLQMAARAGHAPVLKYVINEYLQVCYDSSLLCATVDACRAGQLECAMILMSQSLLLNPTCLSHNALAEQRLMDYFLPNTMDVERQRIYRMTIVHLDPQNRQVGAGMYNCKKLREYCGKRFLNNNDRLVAIGVGLWAIELIKVLVTREAWVPPSKSCIAVGRILTLFWATVEASFLLLYQYQDGSYVTCSCRKMVEESLQEEHMDATKAMTALIEKHLDAWLKSELQYGRETGLRQQDLRVVYAAGHKDGLKIMARGEKDGSGAWCKRVCLRRLFLPKHGLRTVGQYALWLAIKKLRPENVELLLVQGIRLPKRTPVVPVTWSYRRTREESYQAVWKLLRKYQCIRPARFVLRRPDNNRVRG